MSRSHTCYECGGHTEAYDDAYCVGCAAKLMRPGKRNGTMTERDERVTRMKRRFRDLAAAHRLDLYGYESKFDALIEMIAEEIERSTEPLGVLVAEAAQTWRESKDTTED